MSLSNVNVEFVFNTGSKLPEQNQVVEVVSAHEATSRRQFIALDVGGTPIFYNAMTRHYHVGHCNWRHVTKKCTGCARCSPDNCYDIKPRDGCVAPSKWIDSLDVKPARGQEIWVCNGEGGEVYLTRYCGPEFSYYHGLYGTLPGLRDDHYFWQNRPAGIPPATRVFVKPAHSGWHDDGNSRPADGQWVWIQRGTGDPVICKYSGARYLFECVEGSELGHIYPGNRPWHLLTPPSI